MKQEITMQMLNDADEHSIIASGETVDNSEGLNMSNSGKPLRWVAVRGGINDWAVYTLFANNSYEYIHTNGDKVFDRRNLNNILNFSDEVYKQYRH